jgi:hypothetical protein
VTWDGANKNSGKSVFDAFPRRSPWSAQASLRLLHRKNNQHIKAAAALPHSKAPAGASIPDLSHKSFNPALPVATLTPGYRLSPRGLRQNGSFPTETSWFFNGY